MEIDSLSPKRALAIYAHPNDAELACGGTLAKWSNSGSTVGLLVVSAGDKGRNESNESDLERIRRDETAAACKVLGVELVEMLGLSDGDFENDSALRVNVTSAIRKFKPEVVITHDSTARIFGDVYVNHRDHRVVGDVVLDVVQSAVDNAAYPPKSAPHLVRSVYLSATELPSVAVDISNCLGEKVRSMIEHRSQIEDKESVDEAVRSRAENDGRVAKLKAAEIFRKLSIA